MVFNSDCEEQCTSNVSDVHMTSEHSNYTVATNKVWHDRKEENNDIVIQFNVSDPAVNPVVHLMSYKIRLFII
jgi:hypothetical protein